MIDLLIEGTYTTQTRSFILPSSLTAITLASCFYSMPKNLPAIPNNTESRIPLVQSRPWENNYTPSSMAIDYSDTEKLNILKSFTKNLMSNTQDIPNEFAKILSEQFWELI